MRDVVLFHPATHAAARPQEQQRRLAWVALQEQQELRITLYERELGWPSRIVIQPQQVPA